MISKPIITIDKFSEMTDNGGMFFVDGGGRLSSWTATAYYFSI